MSNPSGTTSYSGGNAGSYSQHDFEGGSSAQTTVLSQGATSSYSVYQAGSYAHGSYALVSVARAAVLVDVDQQRRRHQTWGDIASGTVLAAGSASAVATPAATSSGAQLHELHGDAQLVGQRRRLR